ncbi:hypothetical protein CKAH01_16366 [Colletotrichum kahawae]|uniref:Uncharacterized protein n=1 Tax=Colletotrichum kahawae TaxID=34407 RepID=A0AAD9YG88_COLKA|nr:hypothetical protein CKAH01_16366 [Colletotrichum kahawae]
MSPAQDQYYYVIPNVSAMDPNAREVDLASQSWIQATIIEDDDLMFGGKSLSTWYEEERRRLSNTSSDEEEHRGRQRVRHEQPQSQSQPKQHVANIPKVRKHHSSHKHHHHHHHQSAQHTGSSDKKH